MFVHSPHTLSCTFTVAVLFAKRQVVEFQLGLQTRCRLKNVSDKDRH